MSDTAHTHAAAHQFDDLGQQHEAVTLGMWVFLVTEVLFFGGLFAGYAYYRYAYPAGWAAASHTLDPVIGAVNTVVLLTSSLTMAMAVRSAQLARSRTAGWFVAATMTLGLVFLGIKAYEWRVKFQEHHVPGPSFNFEEHHASGGPGGASADEMIPHPDNGGYTVHGTGPKGTELFFSFYFAMTGLHALHMLVGVGLLTVFTILALRGRYDSGYSAPVEVVGLYWHFVDIIWIFLFPLLYLVAHHARGGAL